MQNVGTLKLNHYTSHSLVGWFLLIVGYVYVSFMVLNDSNGFSYLYLLMLVQLTPFVMSYTAGRADFIGFIMFNHFFNYSVAKHNQISNLVKVNQLSQHTVSALKELIICSVITITSYWILRRFFQRKLSYSLEFKPLSLTRNELIVISIYLILCSTIAEIIPVQYRTIHFVVSTAAIVLLFTSRTSQFERLSFALKVLAILSIGLFFLNTGSLAIAATFGTILFVVTCLTRRPRNIIILVILIAFTSAIQPVKNQFRNVLHDNPNLSTPEKLLLLFELMTTKYAMPMEMAAIEEEQEDEQSSKYDPDQENVDIKEGILRGFGRIGDDSLERVLALTPSAVPYWGGETYIKIPFMFIPRYIWPNKPSWSPWNKFGRTYGFLSPDDNVTSVGVSYLGEAYMNFGFVGMYFFAALVGIVFVLAEWLALKVLGGPYQFTFICGLITVMTYAIDLGSMLHSIVFMFSILFLLRWRLKKMIPSEI